MRFWILALTIACAGCGSDGDDKGASSGATVESCTSQFSPSAGYGWEDDVAVQVALPDGGTAPEIPAPERAASECTAAGQPAPACDADLLMTRDAAMCIAEGLGLSSGIAPWKAGLTYNVLHERIVWNVVSTLENDGKGRQSGDSVTIDAIDGTLLDRSQWGSIP